MTNKIMKKYIFLYLFVSAYCTESMGQIPMDSVFSLLRTALYKSDTAYKASQTNPNQPKLHNLSVTIL